MSDIQGGDSYVGWIIGTLVSTLAVVWGLLVTVVKYVESIFKTRIKDLEDKVKVLEAKHTDCEELRHSSEEARSELRGRVAALEAIHELEHTKKETA
jgi:F0F1-type ATP synthase membrane subunit b/b'